MKTEQVPMKIVAAYIMEAINLHNQGIIYLTDEELDGMVKVVNEEMHDFQLVINKQ